MDDDERFWSNVRFEDEEHPENGCMLWTAYREKDGSCRFRRKGKRHEAPARWLYKRLRGPIPDDVDLVYLCFNTDCVNPNHVMPMDIDHRYWEKVKLEDEAFPENGCMIWTAAFNEMGYGIFSERGKLVLAMRWIYERLRGPIPEGCDLDHLCRVRHCVNPDHLQPVTRRENLRRSPISFIAHKAQQTHCIHGHEFTPENTYWYGEHKRQRMCLTCNRIRQNKYKTKRRTIS